MSRHLIALVALAVVAWAANPAPRAQAPGTPLTVLARDGRRALPVRDVAGREYVALDDVATTFGVDVRDDRLAGGVTVSAGSTTILLTESQAVVSVGGRLVSLPAPPVRQGGRWLVPVDFLVRALGPALGTRYDYRRDTRLLVVGDLSVPRVRAGFAATETGATLTFDITPAAAARVTPANSGLVVAIARADALDPSLPAIPAQGFVQRVLPADEPGTLQIVTGPRYASYRASTSQPDPGSTRLTVELLGAASPTTGASPAPPAPPAPEAPDTPEPEMPAAGLLGGDEPGVRTIVIDPGHGGDETGATGPGGTLEKNVTLAIARRVRTLIESRLGLTVYLTREDDRTLSLDDRTAFANSHRADVFMSLHANAAMRPAMQGAEVYYLSEAPAAAEADGMAASRGTTLPALGGGTRTIDLTPWETAQARYVGQSAALAATAEQALAGRVTMSPRAVQQAPFRVLVGATMPAVLVEIGYLSNPAEERQLASGAYQDRVAQALFDAVARYRATVDRSASQQ